MVGKRRSSGPDDRHDVEPAGLLEHPVAAEEMERGEGQAALLLEGDGLGRDASASGLDLDEDERVAVARDQIDLPLWRPVTPEDDPHPGLPEMSRGGALAPVAEPAVPEGPQARRPGRRLGFR